MFSYATHQSGGKDVAIAEATRTLFTDNMLFVTSTYLFMFATQLF